MKADRFIGAAARRSSNDLTVADAVEHILFSDACGVGSSGCGRLSCDVGGQERTRIVRDSKNKGQHQNDKNDIYSGV